jgi:hypothetical protein
LIYIELSNARIEIHGAVGAISLGFAGHEPHFMDGGQPDRNAGGRTGAG